MNYVIMLMVYVLMVVRMDILDYIVIVVRYEYVLIYVLLVFKLLYLF